MTEIFLDCFDCGYRAEGDEGTENFDECENCASDNTERLEGIPCPNGVTAADWIPGMGYEGCADENHEGKSGLHLIHKEE
jgi:hypothetical protein